MMDQPHAPCSRRFIFGAGRRAAFAEPRQGAPGGASEDKSSATGGSLTCAKPLRQSGATLVELVMTIVIISIAIAGVVGAFATISGRSADVLNQTRSVKLAQLYMDEILSKKYDHATPRGGTPPYSGSCSIDDNDQTRSTYDDVDDYDSLTEAPATAIGPIAGYNGFSVSISVSCAGADLSVANADAKRIDIKINDPGGQSYGFSAYRVNF